MFSSVYNKKFMRIFIFLPLKNQEKFPLTYSQLIKKKNPFNLCE